MIESQALFPVLPLHNFKSKKGLESYDLLKHDSSVIIEFYY